MNEALEIVREKISSDLKRLDKGFQGVSEDTDLTMLFLNALNRDISLSAKYNYWLLTQIREIKFTSIRDLFPEDEIEEMINSGYASEGNCHKFSYNLNNNRKQIYYTIGEIVVSDDITGSHGVNRIIMPDKSVHYFDFISEIVFGEKVNEIPFVFYKDFTNKKELEICLNKAQFFDRTLLFWFQRNVLAKTEHLHRA